MNEWLNTYLERIEKKNLQPEEIGLIEDFETSLAVIIAFNGDVNNPIVKFHLARSNYILNFFSKTDTD